MNKIDLLKDSKFVDACSKYGLEVNSGTAIKIGKNWIVVTTDNEYIKIVFDYNYNCFYIDQYEFTDSNSYIDQLYDDYSKEKNLSEPFSNLSVQDIMNLANKIKIIAASDYGASKLLFNGWELEEKDNEYCIGLLSYIKILGNEIERYNQENYRMALIVGVELPTIDKFLNNIIAIIDGTISKKDYSGNSLIAKKVLGALGENNNSNLGLINNVVGYYNHESKEVELDNLFNIPRNGFSTEKLDLSKVIVNKEKPIQKIKKHKN